MNSLKKNFVADTDLYKYTHHLQRPDSMSRIYEYGESRVGSDFPFVHWFGMQMILNDHFVGKVVTRENILEAEELSAFAFGTNKYFNRKMWDHILNKYGGYLPLTITSAPEGLVIPISNVLFDITSHDRKCLPLVGHAETLLMHAWYATTVSTQGRYIRDSIRPFIDQTGTPEIAPYCVHDFGFRGTKNWDAAGKGGAAALLNSDGTDTSVGMRMLKHHYGEMKGSSVWATEHSVATVFGLSLEDEIAYMNHQLDKCPDEMILSVVIDSKDTYNFLENVAGNPEIKAKIKARPGRVVFRPDSGIPKDVINRCLEILRNVFGYTINEKGYKVLNDNVGLLQGDGMDRDSIVDLYSSIVKNNWSSDNLVVGSGGGLLEKMNRDTQRFAIKASYGEMNDDPKQGFMIHKDPSTMKSKASKKGMLKLHPTGDSYSTISSADETPQQFRSYVDVKEKVFENGVLTRKYSLQEVIANGER